MNKADLIEEVAKVTSSKKEAEEAVGAVLTAIKKALKKRRHGNACRVLVRLVSAREKPVPEEIRRRVKPLRSPRRKFPVFKAGKRFKGCGKISKGFIAWFS